MVLSLSVIQILNNISFKKKQIIISYGDSNENFNEFLNFYRQICIYRRFHYRFMDLQIPYISLVKKVIINNKVIIINKTRIINTIKKLLKKKILKKKKCMKLSNLRYRELRGKFPRF